MTMKPIKISPVQIRTLVTEASKKKPVKKLPSKNMPWEQWYDKLTSLVEALDDGYGSFGSLPIFDHYSEYAADEVFYEALVEFHKKGMSPEEVLDLLHSEGDFWTPEREAKMEEKQCPECQGFEYESGYGCASCGYET